MNKLSLLHFIKPSALARGLSHRGPKGAALHLLRRMGAKAEKAWMGPYLLRINPMGYVCNHTCPMCWLQHLDPEELQRQKQIDREEGMKLADYVGLFDSMPLGFEEVNIVGGGEPLVHPDAVAIMREVKRRGLRGWLITNGTLLRESVARAMIEIQWDVLRVSVHAGDRATYEKIQGVDRFEILRENLKSYHRLRRESGLTRVMDFKILNVIQRENIPSIDRLFQFAEDVGADSIVFEKIIPYSDGQRLAAEEFQRASDALAACARTSSIPCNLDEILAHLRVEAACASTGQPFKPANRCSVGFDQSFITATGDVMPCCFSTEVMGNVCERPFKEIWLGEKYVHFRRRLIQGRFAGYCISNRCTMKGVLHD